MKFLTFVLLFSSMAHAWEIKIQKDETVLFDEMLKEPVEVSAQPEKKEVYTQDLSKDVVLIIYLENIGGTKEIQKVYSCAGFSKKSGKIFFKDETCKVQKLTDKAPVTVRGGTFKVKGNKVLYKFEELEDSFAF